MTDKNIEMLKENLRKEMFENLRAQAPSLRGERSGKIQKKLISGEDFQKAKTVMSYVAMATEVDTGYINAMTLEMGKRLVVPFIESESQTIVASELRSLDNLVRGPLGIYVPKDGLDSKVTVEEIDIILVPGIAFDRNNVRLGRGKGYYDRFLAGVSLFFPKTIGLAFQFQIVDTIPADTHDIKLSTVVSD
ncbi:MAG: 5-formyltetrahydrofolate cyclo-ligase [Candidatus Omnitrophica bacterium]|nr:5-formyltetrahydrofolate cyclo-ligase [Candidatus Omnitrophota bacterium]